MRKTSYFAMSLLLTGLNAQAADLLGIAPASADVGSRSMAQSSVNASSSANSRDVTDPGIPTAPPLQSAAPIIDTSATATTDASGSTNTSGSTAGTPKVRGTAGTTTTGTTTGAMPAAGMEPEIIRLNETGRMNQTLTPSDSANTRADLYVSNAIRQSLVKSGLSSTARNVKIVTTNGRVTLSGRVNSEAEKAKIESLARGAAGSVTMDSQLSVKGKTY